MFANNADDTKAGMSSSNKRANENRSGGATTQLKRHRTQESATHHNHPTIFRRPLFVDGFEFCAVYAFVTLSTTLILKFHNSLGANEKKHFAHFAQYDSRERHFRLPFSLYLAFARTLSVHQNTFRERKYLTRTQIRNIILTFCGNTLAFISGF